MKIPLQLCFVSPKPTTFHSKSLNFDTLTIALLLSLTLSTAWASAQRAATVISDPFQLPEEEYKALDVPDVSLPDPVQRRPVSLEQILAYASRNAPSLQVARERIGLGHAKIAAAEPLLPANPRISVGVGPGLNSGGNHVDISGSISQQFEIAGERGLRIKAANRTLERLHAELDEVRWEVHRNVHAAFHHTLVAREKLAAAARLLNFQERLLEIARTRLQAGDISPLPVRLAEGELSQARVARIAAKQSYFRARLQLGALAGWPTSHPPEPAGKLDEPRHPPETSALIAIARTHQPRLRTLHASQAEARAELHAEDRDAWPEPSIGLQVMREGFAEGPPETQILGVLSIPIPLFQRNQGRQVAALTNTRIAEAEQSAFEAQLLSLIEQNRTAVLAAAARLRTYGQEILPTFEENLRLIQRAFELGEIDILQVSVARERFLRIQTDVLNAYDDYFQAVADLEASIGTDLCPEKQHEHIPSKGVEP